MSVVDTSIDVVVAECDVVVLVGTVVKATVAAIIVSNLVNFISHSPLLKHTNNHHL